MRYLFLLLSLIAIVYVVLLQMNVFQHTFYATMSSDNPNNIQNQLNKTEDKMDVYNQKIETMQKQTENALGATNR